MIPSNAWKANPGNGDSLWCLLYLWWMLFSSLQHTRRQVLKQEELMSLSSLQQPAAQQGAAAHPVRLLPVSMCSIAACRDTWPYFRHTSGLRLEWRELCLSCVLYPQSTHVNVPGWAQAHLGPCSLLAGSLLPEMQDKLCGCEKVSRVHQHPCDIHSPVAAAAHACTYSRLTSRRLLWAPRGQHPHTLQGVPCTLASACTLVVAARSSQ